MGSLSGPIASADLRSNGELAPSARASDSAPTWAEAARFRGQCGWIAWKMKAKKLNGCRYTTDNVSAIPQCELSLPIVSANPDL
jgi:hypothetical protein